MKNKIKYLRIVAHEVEVGEAEGLCEEGEGGGKHEDEGAVEDEAGEGRVQGQGPQL